jgi:hypothetical protein
VNDQKRELTQTVFELTANDGVTIIERSYSMLLPGDHINEMDEICFIYNQKFPEHAPHTVKIIAINTSPDEGRHKEILKQSIKEYFIKNFKDFRPRSIITDKRFQRSSRFVQGEILNNAVKLLCGDEGYFEKSVNDDSRRRRLRYFRQ